MVDLSNPLLLRQRIGEEVATSEWFEITQERINQFAEATDDRQWIHVDPARAAAESPYKVTIAHGYLTLSLTPALIRRAMSFSGLRLSVNYGLNRVRFITAVPSGSRIRARFAPASVEEIGGGIQIVWNVTIDLEGAEKPCCVAEWLVRYYPSST
jgi:acyl dehydratase